MSGTFATARRGVDARYIRQKRAEGFSIDSVARMSGVSAEDVRSIAPFAVVRPTVVVPGRVYKIPADPIAVIAREAERLNDVALRRAVGLLAGMVSERGGVAEADAVLENIGAANRRSAKPVQVIVAEVAEAYGCTSAEVFGRSRNRAISAARHAAYYEVKTQRPWLSLPQVGRIFGRDHTTILYGIRKHAALIGGVS